MANRPYICIFFSGPKLITNVPFGIGIYVDLKVDDVPPPSLHDPPNCPVRLRRKKEHATAGPIAPAIGRICHAIFMEICTSMIR